MNAGGPDSVGWFGKIPSLGDFATRGLPVSFVRPWDEWLSGQLSQARQVWGEGWDQAYAGVPTLGFSLSPSALDESAWHGILLPSVDRVGRQFPLTIALSCARDTAARFGAGGWAELAAIGRRALESGCAVEGVDEALASFLSSQLESREPAELEVGRIASALAMLPDGTSLWWSAAAADPADAAPIIYYGLPRGEWFRELLCPRCSEPGWLSVASRGEISPAI